MSDLTVFELPDIVLIQSEENDWQRAEAGPAGTWNAAGVRVNCDKQPSGADIKAEFTGLGLLRIRLRWRIPTAPDALYLGDAFERGYGDLAWLPLIPERFMPWYVLIHSSGRTDGIGVRTGAGSFATWGIDSSGISLDLDCRSGGVGVRPQGRILKLATIVTRRGTGEESPFAAATQFCQRLCDKPRLAKEPVYGANNWYYAYGQTTGKECLEDAERVSLWSESANRPWMVLDDGWQQSKPGGYNGGPWRAGNKAFPDMPALASNIVNAGARPGLWYRPLLDDGTLPQSCYLKAERPHGWFDRGGILDPTIAEVQHYLKQDMQRLVSWGYGLIKHDFSTYDLLGYWGSGIAGPWIADGWSFNDRSQTSAEIISNLYQLLRDAAGDAILIGCNTIGHLAAGTHEVQRTGNDTSGRNWESTRRMGINTVAFRMPQHNAFFACDGDCVGLTNAIPWEFNRQWLELLARSGTPLFVSAAPEAVGPEQESALRQAFSIAAKPRAMAEPLDWLNTTCPKKWRFADGENTFDWTGDAGCPAPGIDIKR